MGMGMGYEIFTHDIPVPIWEGDGSVTGWQGSVDSTPPSQCWCKWTATTTLLWGKLVVKVEGRGMGHYAYPLRRYVFSSHCTYLY
jgi:hypothetical protein